MKRIYSILMLTMSLLVFSQNQTFTGVKTFNQPPMFKNVQYDPSSKKILVLDEQNKLKHNEISEIIKNTHIEPNGVVCNPFQEGDMTLMMYPPYGFWALTNSSSVKIDPYGIRFEHNGDEVTLTLNDLSNLYQMYRDNYLIPVYADNESAKLAFDFAVNKKYRTPTGQLMITY